MKESTHAKHQHNPLSRFSRTPTCDRHTQTHRQTDRHTAIAYTALA